VRLARASSHIVPVWGTALLQLSSSSVARTIMYNKKEERWYPTYWWRKSVTEEGVPGVWHTRLVVMVKVAYLHVEAAIIHELTPEFCKSGANIITMIEWRQSPPEGPLQAGAGARLGRGLGGQDRAWGVSTPGKRYRWAASRLGLVDESERRLIGRAPGWRLRMPGPYRLLSALVSLSRALSRPLRQLSLTIVSSLP